MSIAKTRLLWAAAFIVLLSAEVCIALFVRDSFVRPYLGDVLAAVTVYCGGRIVFPHRFAFLSAAVMVTALCVELLQLKDFSALFPEGSFLAVLVGSTFDPCDLLCYGAGGILCVVCDIILYKLRKRKQNDQL